MNTLELNHVSHRFNRLLAVDDVTLTVNTGELLLLVGPSGCGKTTLLRLAAGLEVLQDGAIRIGGAPMADAGHNVPPEARGVGLVFQDYALFPHLDVLDNVAFGLTDAGRDDRRQRSHEALDLVGMAGQCQAYPHELSGGQMQRVALARALAPKPRVILLDEPFSGLDARLREQVRDETLHLLKEAGTTALMVTHDPEEAMFMADRIAVMNHGRIAQLGAPQDLYFAPQSAFVASFFSDVNQLTGIARGGHVATPLGPVPASALAEGQAARILIRPEALSLADAGSADTCQATVTAARLLGRTSLIHLAVPVEADQPLHMHARVPGCVLPPVHTMVGLRLNTGLAFVFPAEDAT